MGMGPLHLALFYRREFERCVGLAICEKAYYDIGLMGGGGPSPTGRKAAVFGISSLNDRFTARKNRSQSSSTLPRPRPCGRRYPVLSIRRDGQASARLGIVARRHMTRVDRRPARGQQRDKGGLRPLQMKGDLVIAVDRHFVKIAVPGFARIDPELLVRLAGDQRAVNGLPSCHLMPWRNMKVSFVPSSFHDQLEARSGTIDARLFCFTC
jgi:hypothetical protein